MPEFLTPYMTPQTATWLAYAAIVLVGLWILWMLVRGVSGVRRRGERARQARLAVIDAEEVDGRRRLVLIRRDGVEHLLMIGGPTDIVIESGIGLKASRQPAVQAPAKDISEPSQKNAPTPAAQTPKPKIEPTPAPPQAGEKAPASVAVAPSVGKPDETPAVSASNVETLRPHPRPEIRPEPRVSPAPAGVEKSVSKPDVSAPVPVTLTAVPPTPPRSTSPGGDEWKKGELDGEIQELLDQMSRKTTP